MPYIVKWVKSTGDVGQSAPHPSPSEALRFLRTLAALRPQQVWAEDDAGHRYPLTVAASAADDRVEG